MAEEFDFSSGAPESVRRKLCIALDTDDLATAISLAARVLPWVGVAKVGLELYSAQGPRSIEVLKEMGFRVFCDLKMYDIPNTVRRAAFVLGSSGVDFATVHAHGGTAMMRAAVEGLTEGARWAGNDVPIALAVTVLTSDAAAPAHIVPARVLSAAESGCGGVVCAAEDLATVCELAPRLLKVVPGVRPTGSPLGDQVRVASPEEAISRGADLLVVGRPISASEFPETAACQIATGIGRASAA